MELIALSYQYCSTTKLKYVTHMRGTAGTVLWTKIYKRLSQLMKTKKEKGKIRD